MASTTAIALIGSTHPNDSLICPTHLARLVEGDAAAWTLQDLHQPQEVTNRRCSGPDRVLLDLLDLVATQVLGSDPITQRPAEVGGTDLAFTAARHLPRFALSLTVFDESSLRSAIPLLAALENVDLDVSLPIWSRKWSPWSSQITTEGELPQNGRISGLHAAGTS